MTLLPDPCLQLSISKRELTLTWLLELELNYFIFRPPEECSYWFMILTGEIYPFISGISVTEAT